MVQFNTRGLMFAVDNGGITIMFFTELCGLAQYLAHSRPAIDSRAEYWLANVFETDK